LSQIAVRVKRTEADLPPVVRLRAIEWRYT